MKSAHLEHRVGPVTETYPLARYGRPSRRVGFAGGLTKLYIVHCIRQNCCVSQSHKHCFLVVPATNMRRQISSRHHPNCTLIPRIREHRAAHTVHTAIDTPREKNKARTCFAHTHKRLAQENGNNPAVGANLTRSNCCAYALISLRALSCCLLYRDLLCSTCTPKHVNHTVLSRQRTGPEKTQKNRSLI